MKWGRAGFVAYYNHGGCHEGHRQLTPTDVYFRRSGAILPTREKARQKTQSSIARGPIVESSPAGEVQGERRGQELEG